MLLGSVACGRTEDGTAQRDTNPPAQAAPAQAAPAQVQAAYVDDDRENLLDISRGAAVLSRTAELNLEQSAIHAIDGMSTTRWLSPPGGAEQTLVASLAAPSRVEQLGIVTTSSPAQIPSAVRFESSVDGTSWREVFVLKPIEKDGRQVANVPPFDAQYLRVTTIEPVETDTLLRSVIVLGRETGQVAAPSFDGCWTVNGSPARLLHDGVRLSGVIGGQRATAIDGGVEGRVARVMWVRGPMWGYAAMTVAPGRRALSAVTFHEEILIGNAGVAWFGEPCDSALQVESATPVTFLRRAGRWSMFGLSFDGAGRLDEQASTATLAAAAATIASAQQQRFRIVSREFREASPQQNRERSATRLESVRVALEKRGVDLARVELVAAGSDTDSIEPTFAVMRLLASRIDLEIVQ